MAEDRLEIADLMARYAHSFDEGRPADFADLFTEDGVFNSILSDGQGTLARGREELIALATKSAATRSQVRGRHFQSGTMFLELTPERALSRTFVMLTRVSCEPGSMPTVFLTGVYEEELVRTPKGWRFKKRSFVADPVRRPDVR